MLEKVERLICEINRVDLLFAKDYFETGKVEKINLSRTISKVPLPHILNYRLNLHESINDYLIVADVDDINYYYRVKTGESIIDKIDRYTKRADQYPVHGWLNDIFGARIVLTSEQIAEVLEQIDEWHDKYYLKNWYIRDKGEYKGIHIYFKNQSNFYFPWELQIWDQKDVTSNIENHRLYKRNFVVKPQ